MRKLTYLLLFLVAGLSGWAQEVKISHNLPATLNTGQSFDWEITINKGSIVGFAKIQLDIPSGFGVEEVDIKGGTFTYENDKAKIVWVSMPGTDAFSFKLRLRVPASAFSVYIMTAKFNYILNNVKKECEMPQYELHIQETAANNVAAADNNHSPKTEAKPETPTTPPVIEHSKTAEEMVNEVKITEHKSVETVKPTENKVTETKPIETTKPTENKATETKPVETVNTNALVANASSGNTEAVKTVQVETVNPTGTQKQETNTTTTASETPKATEIKPVHTEPKHTEPTTKATETKTTTPPATSAAVPGLVFKVQLGSFSNNPGKSKYAGMSVDIKQEGGVFKVYSGNFKTYEEATKHKQSLIAKGHNGFVVKFQDGVRLK